MSSFTGNMATERVLICAELMASQAWLTGANGLIVRPEWLCALLIHVREQHVATHDVVRITWCHLHH